MNIGLIELCKYLFIGYEDKGNKKMNIKKYFRY